MKIFIKSSSECVKASYSDHDFDKYSDVINKYMPPQGQGSTKASQTATAVNRIIYRWYNDGDVYDNNWYYGLYSEGADNVTDCANWLYKYTTRRVQQILSSIHFCETDEDYENILSDLAEYLLDDDLLIQWEEEPAEGDIYNCDGPFEFDESFYNDYEEDDWY